jgi:hypothetical protein
VASLDPGSGRGDDLCSPKVTARASLSLAAVYLYFSV